MPILHIEIVKHPGEFIHPEIARELTNRTGEIFGSEPGGTWVNVHSVPCIFFAENHSGQAGIYPVFVTVLIARRRSRRRSLG
jgi:hypothetical protein